MTLFWLFLALLGAMVVVMNLAWAFQRQVGDSGWIDVFWTFGTGCAGAAAALWPMGEGTSSKARQLLVSVLVLAWSLRLGLYVAFRVARSGEDARYAGFRRDWGGAYQARLWLAIQPPALATAQLCLSIAVAARAPGGPLGARDVLGAAILLTAILGEALADRQLARFKAGQHEKGAVCDRGLWAWSRHPNYFFERLGWLAYPAIALD